MNVGVGVGEERTGGSAQARRSGVMKEPSGVVEERAAWWCVVGEVPGRGRGVRFVR